MTSIMEFPYTYLAEKERLYTFVLVSRQKRDSEAQCCEDESGPQQADT